MIISGWEERGCKQSKTLNEIIAFVAVEMYYFRDICSIMTEGKYAYYSTIPT